MGLENKIPSIVRTTFLERETRVCSSIEATSMVEARRSDGGRMGVRETRGYDGEALVLGTTNRWIDSRKDREWVER